MSNHTSIFLPAEWAEQDAILMSWPHAGTDWCYMLQEVCQCYHDIAEAITSDQDLVIVTPEPASVEAQLSDIPNQNRVHIYRVETNDTWARDFGAITVVKDGKNVPLDFKFNGWGLKFAACRDNLINRGLEAEGVFANGLENHLNFVLEGGSIESDGNGTIMTTSNCLLSPNRNGEMTKQEIEDYLKSTFGAKQVLWVDHGDLEGDDTDSHIDTLARFAEGNTIVFTECSNAEDSHYHCLKAMGEQIATFRNADGKKYNLVTVPLPDAIFDEDGLRLPATYANFLITNHSVLVPIYNQPQNDKAALDAIAKAMPNRRVVGIDCNALIKQHGSLHCVTMQFPKNSLNL